MSNVLEQSIEGISFIEKAEHSCNDLEESISKLTDTELRCKTDEFKNQLKEGKTLFLLKN